MNFKTNPNRLGGFQVMSLSKTLILPRIATLTHALMEKILYSEISIEIQKNLTDIVMVFDECPDTPKIKKIKEFMDFQHVGQKDQKNLVVILIKCFLE